MKRATLVLSIFAVLLTGILGASFASVSAFDPFTSKTSDYCTGTAKDSAICSDKSKTSDPLTGKDGIIYKVTIVVARITAIASVIIIVISGLMFVAASGDSSKIADARKALTYSLIGIGVVFSAQGVILFVVSRL